MKNYSHFPATFTAHMAESAVDPEEYLPDYNSTMEIEPDGKEITTYVVTTVFAAIFVIGVCGNLMLIYTVLRNLSMQSPQNIYLAVSYFISVPFAGTIYITSTWPFGLVLCKFNAMLQVISIGVSIFTLLILSIDRYTAIVTPFKLHNKRSSRGCAPAIQVKIVAIWIVSILCALPDAVNTTLEEMTTGNNHTTTACSPYPQTLGSYHLAVVLCKFFVYFVIPVSLITVVYGLMARQLLTSAEFLPASAPGNQQNLQKQMKTRKSLAKLFLVMVLLFVLCFLPKHIFLIWFYGDPNSMEHYNLGWHIFKLFSHCLAYVNSCINPVTLYFLSKVFRRYFNRIMCSACRYCVKGKSTDNDDKEWFRRPSCNTRTSMPDVSGYALEGRRRSENASFHNNLSNMTFSKNGSLSPLPI